MRPLRLLAAILFLVVPSFCQSESFVNRIVSSKIVLGEPIYGSFFVPINVESSAYSGQIVVQVSVLASYLADTEGMDKKALQETLYDLVKNQSTFHMKDIKVAEGFLWLEGANIWPNTFRIVRLSDPEKVSSLSCTEIIRKYFDTSFAAKASDSSDCAGNIVANDANLYLHPKFGLDLQNEIVVRLFKLDIPLTYDDIAGTLRISRSATQH